MAQMFNVQLHRVASDQNPLKMHSSEGWVMSQVDDPLMH